MTARSGWPGGAGMLPMAAAPLADDVKLPVVGPSQGVSVADAGGVERDRRAGGVGVVLAAAVRCATLSGPWPDGEPLEQGLGVHAQQAAPSRSSGRLPQIGSGAPKSVLPPCMTYSAPSGPKADWLVMWSLIDRGRPTTTPVVVRPGPLSSASLPVKSGPAVAGRLYCDSLTQMTGLEAVADGSKVMPVIVSAPPLLSWTVV